MSKLVDVARQATHAASEPAVQTEPAINVVKVFSATKSRERDALGDGLTSWLRARPNLMVVAKDVRLSSDAEFHCLTIVVFAHQGLSAVD